MDLVLALKTATETAINLGMPPQLDIGPQLIGLAAERGARV